MYCKSKKATPGKHRHNQLRKIASLRSTHVNVNSINDTSSKHIKPLCSSAAGEGTKDPFTKLSVILRQVWSAI